MPLTWGQSKLRWKLLHAALMLLALLLAAVGLGAVFGFHNAENIPNLYSLHSWIGIAAIALFAFQVGRRSSGVGRSLPSVFDVPVSAHPVGCWCPALPAALLTGVSAPAAQTCARVAGRQRPGAQRGRRRLRDQREALLRAVSAARAELTLLIAPPPMTKITFSTGKEALTLARRTAASRLRPSSLTGWESCWWRSACSSCCCCPIRGGGGRRRGHRSRRTR